MRRVNLSQAQFEDDPEDPEPFRAGRARFRDLRGRHSGASLGKLGIWTDLEGEDVMARRADAVGYYDGEQTR